MLQNMILGEFCEDILRESCGVFTSEDLSSEIPQMQGDGTNLEYSV